MGEIGFCVCHDDDMDLEQELPIGVGESLGRCETEDVSEAFMEVYETLGMLQMRHAPGARTIEEARQICKDFSDVIVGVDNVDDSAA